MREERQKEGRKERKKKERIKERKSKCKVVFKSQKEWRQE